MRTTFDRIWAPVTLALWAWLTLPPPATAAAVYKCSVNGTVAYQNVPCAQGGAAERPTVEQLNAERQQRLQQARISAAAPAGSGAGTGRLANLGAGAPPGAAPAKAAFRCDGRTHCQQMASCAEATYFLAHCPGVKMDGDGDGVPCEAQWCGH